MKKHNKKILKAITIAGTLFIVVGVIYSSIHRRDASYIQDVYERVQRTIDSDPNYFGIYSRIEPVRSSSKWRERYNNTVRKLPFIGNSMQLSTMYQQKVIVSEFVPGKIISSRFLIEFSAMSEQGLPVSTDLNHNHTQNPLNTDELSAMVNNGISQKLKGKTKQAEIWFHKALQAGAGRGALELAKLHLVINNNPEKVKKYLKIALKAPNMREADLEEAKYLLSLYNIEENKSVR